MFYTIVRGSDGQYYRQDNTKAFIGVALFFGALWLVPILFGWFMTALTYVLAGGAYYLIFKVLQFVYRFVRKQLHQHGE